VSDGPHGLRVQDDDNPAHLGLGRSLPATCFPPAVTLASSWDPGVIRSVGKALGRVELPIARADLEHRHPDAGWVFAGEPMEVSVGSSSHDIRLQAAAEVPGHPVAVRLTVWSQLGDWMTNPATGPALRKLIEERGGITGRIADLLSDPVSQDSALILSLISVTQFPGFPVSAVEAQGLLTRS
jgi:hypothetical protein